MHAEGQLDRVGVRVGGAVEDDEAFEHRQPGAGLDELDDYPRRVEPVIALKLSPQRAIGSYLSVCGDADQMPLLMVFDRPVPSGKSHTRADRQIGRSDHSVRHRCGGLWHRAV